MLFQIVHSHSSQMCPAQSPEATKQANDWWQAMKKSPGVKVLFGTVSPVEHTFYITVEADDYQALTRALGPLVSMGTGHAVPVLTLDQTLPMAESGVFRANI
ncbi:MAG: DUF3303 family protein [Dehalococcoidales bacterium]|jgi:hypothetical protein